MLVAGLAFFYLTLSAITALELTGTAALDEKEKLKQIGAAFAFSMLSAALREAFKSRAAPMAIRLSTILLLANLYCFISDTLALDMLEDDQPAPASSWRTRGAAPRAPSALRFATKHVVATLLSLVLHYLISAISILLRFVRWRFTTLHSDGGDGAAGSADKGGVRRVLLLYANVGSGHKMAALALQEAFKRRDAADVEVHLLDVMECCPSFFRYQFQTLFQTFTQTLVGQHTLGFLYDAQDKGRAKGELQKLFESFVSLELIRQVAVMRPEVVICTHFLPAQVLAELRNVRARRGNRTVRAQARALPLALVLTDLDLQFMWVNDVDTYFVPRPTAVHMLEAYGGLERGASAVVSGIPIFPAFADKAKDARASPTAERKARNEELRALEGWEGSVLGDGGWPAVYDPRPVLLYISSGNAVGQIYSGLLAAQTPLRIVVCTGRQADVREELAKVAVPPRHAVKMLGFVADKPPTPGGMPTLLRCADLFVGKSGGLAVAEAAALCVPMVVLDPIPGQEQRNADVLLEAGAAVKINDLPLLPRRVDEILGKGGVKAKAMASRIGELGKPDAAAEVVDAVIGRRITPIHTKPHEA